MTTKAASKAVRTAGRLPGWLSVRHSLRSEALVALALVRPLRARRVGSSSATQTPRAHANRLVALERWVHLLFEANVQRAAHALPGLAGLLGVAYLTLHLAVTAGVLLWLHQTSPRGIPVRSHHAPARERASPRRLPRLPDGPAAAGRHRYRRHRLERPRRPQSRSRQLALQPIRRRPQHAIGYALIVGASLFRYGRRLLVRALGALYPPFVLLVVVATGNHFFFEPPPAHWSPWWPPQRPPH